MMPTHTFKSLRVVSIMGVVAMNMVACMHGQFPFGHREAFMRTVDSELANYAANNDGSFPSGHDPFAALAKLYPDYCGVGSELAGISGSIQMVTNALYEGRSLSNLTSWVYVPGLQEGDNPRLAILWETKLGITQSGRGSSQMTRPVLLLDRSITNCADADWGAFLNQQEKLRDAIRASPR